MGSFNTIKATLSHIRASKGAYIHVSATLHYKGNNSQKRNSQKKKLHFAFFSNI